ncbi:MAG: sporulation protein YabP [Christensenellales bacterium]|jgi:sporulation protein YabP
MNGDLQKPARLKAHSVVMDNRERISITGVNDVESFNESEVVLSTEQGMLVVTGSMLHISRLNLDDGQLVVGGVIDTVEYDAIEQKKGGIFSRVFR